MSSEGNNFTPRYNTGVRVTFKQMLWRGLLPVHRDMGQYEADVADQKGFACHIVSELTKCCGLLEDTPCL